MAKRKQTSSTSGSASGNKTKKRNKRSGSSAVKKQFNISDTSIKQTSIKTFTTSKTSSASLSRNVCQSSNSQENVRLPKVSKSRQYANQSPQTVRIQSRQGKKDVASVLELSPEDTRKTRFTQGQVDGWKPISASTVKLSEQIIQTGVSFVLSNSYGEMYDEVRETLDEMSHKLISKIKKLNVPASSIKDYKTALQQKRSVLQQIDLYEEQKDVLESAITRTEKECEHLEEMEASVSDDEIFPLLEEDYNVALDLPVLNKKYNA